MYVNFLSTYSDKKSCHTSTTLQTSVARFVCDKLNLLETLCKDVCEQRARGCYAVVLRPEFKHAT